MPSTLTLSDTTFKLSINDSGLERIEFLFNEHENRNVKAMNTTGI